mgnify:CR=1 FL=1
MKTYKFMVLDKIHSVKAESMGAAMTWMNRNVMDKMDVTSWAWFDSADPTYDFYVAAGDFTS